MFAKISLTAAFLLLVAPPMACASNRNADQSRVDSPLGASQPGIVVAQDDPANVGINDNDNDNDNDATINDDNGDSRTTIDRQISRMPAQRQSDATSNLARRQRSGDAQAQPIERRIRSR